MEATVRLTSGMAFDVEIGPHHLTIDANPKDGGNDLGPTPKPLVLAALAGCTAMDVVSILRKMRQEPTSLAVRAEGRQTEGPHPHTIVDIVVTYEVTGEVNAERLWRAVRLSQDAYCGVSAMVRDHTSVTARVVLNGVDVPAPPGE
jgi:putative redox protein